jgi:hypothetical protein
MPNGHTCWAFLIIHPSKSKVLLFIAIGNLLFSVEIEIIELG